MRDHLSWETTTCSGHYIQVSLYIPKTKALSMHYKVSLQWRHNGHNSISNHQLHDCLLNRLFRRRSKETSKHRVTGLCAGNSPGTGEFPAQMASNAENASIWWHHHVGLPNWTSLFRYFSDHLLNMTFSFDRHCHSLATAAPNEYEHDQINLTHLPLVPHICVIELGQHWFRWWLVAYSVPSHYLNQCWVIVNWTLRNKLQWNFNSNTKLNIHENAFENVCEMVTILFRRRWVNRYFCESRNITTRKINEGALVTPAQYYSCKLIFISIFYRQVSNISRTLVGN